MAARVRGIVHQWLAAGAFRYLLFGAFWAASAFIALVYSVNWKFGVALIGFVTMLTLDLYSLQLGILPVFFAIPFDRLGKLGPESILTWAKLLIGVLVMAYAAHFLVKRDRRPLAVLFRSPLFLLAALTLVFSFVSVINAREYDIFLAQNVRRVSNFVLYILIATIVTSKTLFRRIFYVFLFAYFFVGLTVMYEIATGQSILQTVWGEKDTALEYTLQSGEFRVGGPGGDPDFLAISVLLPTLVGVSLMFEPISRLTKGLILPVLLMTVVSLLATGSRGGLGALLLGAGILWLFTPMRHKYLLAAVAATGLVAGVVGLSLAGTASTQRYTGEAGGKSLTFRLGWTKMAILMIEDHPFVGIGTGNFPRVYNRYSVTVPEVPRKAYWTHNSFLQTWAENGVLAFIVYTGLYAIAALTMFRLIRTTTDPELRHLAVLLLSAVAGYFFFAGTSNVLENENYWIVFALVTAVSSLERERRQDGGHELGAQEPA